ncbi:hypothetical protein [Anaerotignum sp.]|nr:hypothetical protein [Anaerotignum sp.]
MDAFVVRLIFLFILSLPCWWGGIKYVNLMRLYYGKSENDKCKK